MTQTIRKQKMQIAVQHIPISILWTNTINVVLIEQVAVTNWITLNQAPYKFCTYLNVCFRYTDFYVDTAH